MSQIVGNYGGDGWHQRVFAGGVVFLTFLVFVVILLISRYRSRKYLMAKIRREWGQEPERDYDPTEYDCISHYYLQKKCDSFQIDDITWNDLDMDRVFMQMNHTRSFLGESCLYYFLRTPDQSGERLEKLERYIAYFQGHDREREEMEYFFAKIGRTGRSSVFDYVYNLADADSGSNLIHYGMGLLILLSVGFLFVNPQPGILMLIASICLSIGSYEHFKRPVRPYMLSCLAFEKVMNAADDLKKLKVPVLKECQKKVSASAGSFRSMRWTMLPLVAGEQQAGGLEQLIFSYLNSCFHIDLILFQFVIKRLARHVADFEMVAEEIGMVEAAIAVASWRTMQQVWSVPVLHSEGKIQLQAENMVHPLIKSPVANSVRADRSVLITGSNASGKSTFLKTVALQAILAQTIHTVTAAGYEARYFTVLSSMALRDDLVGEESYYMAEIRSLKRILDHIRDGEDMPPVLCFVDEVLRGTNTVERIAASSQILHYMVEKPVLCFAATHDIELTHILEKHYENYHFQEEVQEGDIRFDYKLYPGRAVSRNAIKLLQIMGYEDEVIIRAEQAAEEFLRTGEWGETL